MSTQSKRWPACLFALTWLACSVTLRAEAQSPSDAATAQAADAFMATATEQAVQASDSPNLQIYGFSDFAVNAVLRDGTEAIEGYFGASPAFSIGNLNVYLDADLKDGFRSLAEVRFSYLPNGAADLSTGQRQSTLASDYTLFGQTSAWGGVVIERVWVEYQAHPLFSVRAGQWLTPVGIWNVDHGSPTIIPALKPYVITANMFPIRQTGFELYGSQLLGANTLVGYHLTLSNGRGNLDSYLDFDHNKALGLRLYVTSHALGELTLGVSGFMGRSTDSHRIQATVRNTDTMLSAAIASQYDELTYAADVLWKVANLHVQLELIGNQGVYTEGGRPRASPIDGVGLVPDFARWGGYALFAYRLPWLTLMPFVDMEYVADGNAATGGPASSGRIVAFSAGLNVRPGSSVVLKAQYYHGIVRNQGSKTASWDNVAATIAWSF